MGLIYTPCTEKYLPFEKGKRKKRSLCSKKCIEKGQMSRYVIQYLQIVIKKEDCPTKFKLGMGIDSVRYQDKPKFLIRFGSQIQKKNLLIFKENKNHTRIESSIMFGFSFFDSILVFKGKEN